MRRLKYIERERANLFSGIPGTRPTSNGLEVPTNCHLVYGGERPEVSGALALHKVFYPWVSDYLTDYQRLSVAYTSVPAYHFWHVTGSGKSLAGMVSLLRGHGPYLIIYPGQVRPQWFSQIRQYTTATLCSLTGQTPHTIEPAPGDIYLIGMEVFTYWEQELARHSWRVLVDEEHLYRDSKRGSFIVQHGKKVFVPSDNRSAVLRRISERSSWYLGMTGTPVPKDLIDMWGILDIAEPYCWGGKRAFGLHYLGGEEVEKAPGRMVMEYGNKVRDWKLGEFRNRLKAVSYRVTQAQMGQMPGIRFEFPVLSGSELNAAAAFAKELKQAAKEGNSLEAELRQSSTRKTKYICGRVLDAVRSDQHVLIFTGRHPETERLCDSIRQHLEQHGKSAVPVEYGHGEIDVDERWARRTRYMDAPGASVLVVTGYSVGMGWDFQKTDLAIFAFLPWTPEYVEQWLGRFPRLGQDRPTLCSFPLAEGTKDEAIYNAMLRYLPGLSQVLDNAMLEEWRRDYEESEDAEILKGLMRTCGQTKMKSEV